jgi:hypothetical protein
LADLTFVPPGRELDARVAIALFDFKGHPLDNHLISPSGMRVSTSARIVRGRRVPDYSTDWAAAGEVLEKMREKGWISNLDQDPDGPWWAKFSRAPSCDPMNYGDTGPHAICLAALAACEEKP